MTQVTVTQQYSGVDRRACGEPISLPARAEKAMTASQAGAPGAGGETQPVVFNLRCKACEKENFYGAKDVANIHGAPRLGVGDTRDHPVVRPNLKLARTANA